MKNFFGRTNSINKKNEKNETNKILLLFSSFTQQSFFALLLQAIVCKMAKFHYDVVVKMPPLYDDKPRKANRDLLERDFIIKILNQIATKKSQYDGCFFVPAFSSNHGYNDYRKELLNIAENVCPLVILNDNAKSLKHCTLIEEKRSKSEFDVFLSYNNHDKDKVEDISNKLIERGILPCLNDLESPPGDKIHQSLEIHIKKSNSIAIFFGQKGIGKYHGKEIEASYQEFDRRKFQIIPVFLPGFKSEQDVPLFLRDNICVDFRKKYPDPMEQLVWGITGKRSADYDFKNIKSLRTKNKLGTVYYDSIIGGRIAAKYVLEYGNYEKLRILVVCSSIHHERQDEFEIKIKNGYSNNVIVTKIDADFDRTKAYEKALRELPKFKACRESFDIIFCTNDEMALGVLNALAKLKKDEILTDDEYNNITVIGYDAIREAQELIDIEVSPLRASVAMNTNFLANQATEMLLAMIKNDSQTKSECCLKPCLHTKKTS